MKLIRILKLILNWGWSPILIIAVAIVGRIYEWPVTVMAILFGIILVTGLVIVIISTKEKLLEQSAMRLRQLAGHFNRRFMGDSSLSIFTIIDTLFNLDNPQLWEWARACDMSKRIFNTWCNSFIGRLENDTRTGRFSIYLRAYLNELWLATNHYYEFIEQFYEIAQKVEIPKETLEQYNRFVVEYNSFVKNFSENIEELKDITSTEIEPPSVQMAKELSGVITSQPAPDKGEKPVEPGKNKAYYA
ncbi:hypothetical protein ACFLTT_01850 [Chloroflexota bacterium]